MKNILTLFFVLLMSASVAMAQSTSTNNDSKSNVEQVTPAPAATPVVGNCMGKAATGKSCCQKKSNAKAQSCEGKAAKEACCAKHGSKGKEEEEN